MGGMVDRNRRALLVQFRVVGCTQVQVRIIILKAIHHIWIYVHAGERGGDKQGKKRQFHLFKGLQLLLAC